MFSDIVLNARRLFENTGGPTGVKYAPTPMQKMFDDLCRSSKPDFNPSDWSKSKADRENIRNGLRESLEKIGDGKIEAIPGYDAGEPHLTYIEMFGNKGRSLVVHGKVFVYDQYLGENVAEKRAQYEYEIKVFEGDPKDIQFGGGYGTSGAVITSRTNLEYITGKCCSKEVVSKVCAELKGKFTV